MLIHLTYLNLFYLTKMISKLFMENTIITTGTLNFSPTLWPPCTTATFLFNFQFLGGIRETDNAAYCNRCYHSVVYLSICPSDALVLPAKTIGRNEMALGRDIHVVPSNIVLDGPGPPTGRGDLGVRTPQFALMPAIAK